MVLGVCLLFLGVKNKRTLSRWINLDKSQKHNLSENSKEQNNIHDMIQFYN